MQYRLPKARRRETTKIAKVLIAFLAQFSIANSQPTIWSPIGPAPQLSRNTGAVSGRVWSIAVVPAHVENGVAKLAQMLIAPEGGGLWSSSSFESTAPAWHPILDDLLPAAQIIRSLAVSPKDSSVVYAGGDGGLLLRSTDGGSHWARMTTSTGESILKIIVHPATGQIFFATNYVSDVGSGAAADGVFAQSGAAFTPMTSGLGQHLTYLSDLDFTVDVAGHITLYLGTEKYGDAAASNDVGIWVWQEGSGQWQKMAIGLLDLVTQKTLDQSVLEHVRLAADHQPGSPNGVFAALTNGNTSNLMNVYRLTGQSWSPIGSPLKNFSLLSTFADVVLGLSDAGAVYVGLGNVPAHAIYQSVDSGNHWSSVRTGTNGLTPHTDERYFTSYNGKVYWGNDGGINRFTPLAAGSAGANLWESLSTPSLQTILVNGVAAHPTKPDVALVSSQDNAIALLGNGQWQEVFGADNGPVRFDPDVKLNGQYAYTTGVSDYSFFFRSDDEGKTWNDKSPSDANDQPGHQAAGIDWYAPFAINPTNSQRVVVGIDRVYETFNRGDLWGVQKSPIFKPTAMRADGRPYGEQSSAIAYGMNDRIWVAYGQTIYLTDNDGGDGSAANWNDMSVGTNFGSDILQIRVDPSSPNNVYLATSNRIWKSNPQIHLKAFQWAWRDITANLPPLAVHSLLLVASDQAGQPVLIAGTSAGVYVSFDDGGSWGSFNLGLPSSTVSDLDYASQTDTLLSGLYGRGIYKTSIAEILDVVNQPSVIITIHSPAPGHCRWPPVEGSTVSASYSVVHPLDNNGWTAQWSLIGASVAPGETSTQPTIDMVISTPASPVVVSVVINFANGLQVHSSQPLETISQKDAAIQAFICKMTDRFRPIPKWQWDPDLWQWDSKLNDIRLKKSINQDLLKQQADLTQRLQQLHQAIEERH